MWVTSSSPVPTINHETAEWVSDLARGGTLKAVVEQIGQEVEGINTTRELFQKSSALAVEMPITEQVYGVLFSEASPSEAVTALLSRSVGLEAH